MCPLKGSTYFHDISTKCVWLSQSATTKARYSKRALYTLERAAIPKQATPKEPYIFSKEPYISAKEPPLHISTICTQNGGNIGLFGRYM